MAESDQRQRIVKALRHLDAVSIENRDIGPGTPDVNYLHGWLELKWVREWPARPTTVVELAHYTPQQRAWAVRRRARERALGLPCGCWLLLQVRAEWLLFDGEVAAKVVGRSTRAELIQNAAEYWSNGLNEEELIGILKHGR